MIHYEIDNYISRLGRNIYASVVIAINFLLMIVLFNLWAEEYGQFQQFRRFEGKPGVFLQLLSGINLDEYFIYDVVPEAVGVYCCHNTISLGTLNGNDAYLGMTGLREFDYRPYLCDGKWFDKAAVPGDCIGVVCPSGMAGVKTGDIIEDSIYGCRYYVTGLYDADEKFLGRFGDNYNYSSGQRSYRLMYNTVAEQTERNERSPIKELYMITDYDSLKKASVRFSTQAQYFVVFDREYSEEETAEIVRRIGDYLRSSTNTNIGIADYSDLNGFFSESRKDFFDSVGKFMPLTAASFLVLLSSLISINYINSVENERKTAIERLVGFKKRHIMLMGLIRSLICLAVSCLMTTVGLFLLRFTGIDKRYTMLNGKLFMILFAVYAVCAAIYTLIPYLSLRGRSVMEKLSVREWG